ncbi:MAG: transporter substrate-binding domain-containing protein [Clostridia bacterium]|nr:transporter substrate-binding domain-containing protein [Clostridia bacterium]
MRNSRLIILILCMFLPLTHSVARADHFVYKSATEYDYPPFSVTEGGVADGFSVELLKAVAEEAGISLSFKIDRWSTIKQELEEGKLDVLPLVGYTEERDKYFDFSVPYIVMHGNIFVRKEDTGISSEEDLPGKEIIVMEGDNAQEYAIRIGLGEHLISVDTYEEAFRLLSEGRYDAVLAQGLVGARLIDMLGIRNVEAVTKLDNDGITEITENLSGFEQKFCFAVKEGNHELLSKLNEGLAIVSANGRYSDIYEKWFPYLLNNKPTFEEIAVNVLMITLPILFIILFASLVYVRNKVKKKTIELEKANREILSMEGYLRNQQKLEAIGVLASGVAHEINNPVNGIMNYCQLILEAVDKDSEIAEYARESIHETTRVSKIVKNLLQFSRDEQTRYEKVTIYQMLSQILSLIQAIIQKDQIELTIDIPEDLPEIYCHDQQIQQVLMNLITNARDSVNKKYLSSPGAKKMKLSAESYEHSGGTWVRIMVEDNGTGIDDSVRDRIFDPFFTTKGRHEGMGLGLSISYGIIREHGGDLRFETIEGGGIRFIAELPVKTDGKGIEKAQME